MPDSSVLLSSCTLSLSFGVSFFSKFLASRWPELLLLCTPYKAFIVIQLKCAPTRLVLVFFISSLSVILLQKHAHIYVLQKQHSLVSSSRHKTKLQMKIPCNTKFSILCFGRATGTFLQNKATYLV